MKNKFLCLLLVMCIIFPATLFLNACKKKDDEDKDPQPPTAMEIFNTANTNLDTILDNATVTIVPTAIITTGLMKKYGGDDCTITLKTQNNKAEIFVPKTLSGVDNSKIYFDGMGNYYTESDKINYPMVMATEGYHASSYIEEVVQLNKLVQKISDIAHFYSSAPLKLEEKDGNRYLSLDLDIGTKLNNAFILNYKTNCDEPIALFINKMLSELSQKDIDIVKIVDNFTLSMTDETTALDFVDFMANELGFATDDMVQFFNTEINIANYINSFYNTEKRISSTDSSNDMLFTGYYNYVAPLDIDELDEYPILPLIREFTPYTDITNTELSAIFQSMVEDPSSAFTPSELVAMANNPEMDNMIHYMENTTINLLGLNTKIYLDENNKPTKLLFTLLGDGIVQQDSNTYIPMEINATAECTFSKINETTVSLPIIGNNIEYTFDIALSEEEFNWTDTQKTYKFYADSSILPESFTITMNNINIATFTKHTKTLIVDLIAVREVINTHYGDTTHKENIYSMYDDGTRYKISIRVA